MRAPSHLLQYRENPRAMSKNDNGMEMNRSSHSLYDSLRRKLYMLGFRGVWYLFELDEGISSGHGLQHKRHAYIATPTHTHTNKKSKEPPDVKLQSND